MEHNGTAPCILCSTLVSAWHFAGTHHLNSNTEAFALLDAQAAELRNAHHLVLNGVQFHNVQHLQGRGTQHGSFTCAEAAAESTSGLSTGTACALEQASHTQSSLSAVISRRTLSMEPHLFHVGLDLVLCDLPGQAQTSAEHKSFAHCGLQRKAKSCCTSSGTVHVQARLAALAAPCSTAGRFPGKECQDMPW